MDNTNGWDQYRRMVVDWHEQEVAERKAIKQSLVEYQEEVGKKLDQITEVLARMEGEKASSRYWGSYILPAGVAIASSWIGRKLGF